MAHDLKRNVNQPAGFNLDKELPNSYDAERSVLGAILLNSAVPNPALQQALLHIHSGDFFNEPHRVIFQGMVSLQEKRQPMDLVILCDALQQAGTLERALGGAYISSLIDGVPRIVHVEHYAKIIREKAILRRTIHFAHNCQQRALDGEATPEELLAELDTFRKGIASPFAKRLVAVNFRDFLTMELPALEYVVEPLLTQRGRGMIYSPRGSGKTFVTMQLAYAVAAGLPQFFNWPIAKARPVLYVDGEMHAAMLQERSRQIARMNGLDNHLPEGLSFITRDLQKDSRPKVNTVEGRLQIEQHLTGGDVLILDNISSLSPSSDEKETEDWAQIEDWFSDLCWHGCTVIFVHHAGKGGDQRGTSKREDLLDFVLKMRVPSNYEMEEGLRAELHLTKMRGHAVKGIYGQPFEVAIQRDGYDGRMVWVTRQLKDLLRERARQMLADGMKPNDVAGETGLSRHAVYRIQRGLKFGPGAERGEG